MLRTLILALFLVQAAFADTIVTVSADGPVTNLTTARDHVRTLRKNGETGTVRLQFSAGTFSLTEPVNFTAEDSGLPAGPTIYEAAPGAVVTFTGGKRLSGWKDAGSGTWEAKVDDAKWRFDQLWVNGRRATRARTPNNGYFNAYSQASSDMFSNMKRPQFEAFVARPADFAVLKAIPEAERADVLLTIMQTWTVGQCRIQALNESARAVRIVGDARYPFVEFEPDQRWFLEGFRAALDEPGEWVLSRDRTVFYMPLPGEDMAKAEVVAPVAEKLIVIDGAQNLQFRGLGFQHSQMLYGERGHHDGQAASGIGAAIELDRASGVRFENCEISHTGGYAVWFRDACSGCSLNHSHLHDLGGGGVRIGNIKVTDDKTLTHHITVDDCIIHHGGRMYPSACGIFLAHAADCSVTHCDIADLYYTGISAGWVWGYQHSPSKRNRFDYNHIHHLGWGVLSDMGGFYGLGRAEGTTVSHNHVHDVASYRYGGWGLYTDEGSTGVTMENNLVYDTSEAGFHQHYGKWNQISNNIFAFGRNAQIQRSRPEKHASFAYERNIVVYDIDTLLHGTWYNWEPGTLEMRNNLYWRVGGLPVKFLDGDLAAWQKKTGRDEGSIIADPLFADVAKRDFRFKNGAESPALKLGFKAFDFTEAGVLSSAAAWRQLAGKATFPDFQERSKPWPKPDYVLDTDFESMGLSFPVLPRQEIRWQNKGDSIYVVDDQAASGKRSLKFTDAPNLDPEWDPHLVLKPGYTSGTVSIVFDIRLGDGAKLFVEARGEGHPYPSGPQIAIASNKITWRKGQTSVVIPRDAWVHVEMIGKVGEQADGKWTLRVTLPGEAEKEFMDLPCDKEWKECAWLGFVSTATAKTTFWIDNLKISRAD